IAIDILKEEEKSRHFFGPGPGPSEVLKYDTLGPSGAQFSPDQDWMPRVVLIAKSVYVWLDQLSRKYKRNIEKLDSIPDEELEQLASWGFTGLWLIGLWERSKASKRIKQLCGNPEAVASAYSVFDYSINSDLGGNQAFFDLKKRAWDRGIRLAGDMVPNHMGIDSRWIIDHPEWFLSLESLPYPSYSFSGPDLSWDPRIGIYLEDHYFNRTDAAVVFKRVDRESGTAKFVYHGNDGTSMPWNDTAQLNYLQANVREVVIQTIIKVAQMFPIIRFDAAMVLARKHIQRLWFPEPGHGGAIPSRAEHSTSQASFEALMPKEFWREVVDRVAREAPDTLLLAEAFWLLEGYFVRTLGMHRVYNSAFMNMLKEEDNANFRLSIKNTLSFDPEILKRFVNFMNNPDEETAVKQFGKDDKYFGICILLVTLPGLPMFGHGQIEGLTEKYGHEYRRAYVSEEIDSGLLMYHRRLIFPLMKKRYLFAGANFFRLYTLYSDSGGTEESVIAFSNRYNEERALIVINNSNKAISGWINSSEAYLKKEAFSDSGNLSSETLDQCLGLPSDANVFIILRDHVKDLWYIRSAKGIHDSGLHFILGPYGHQVFVDFRKQLDGDRRMLSRLCDKLQGQGVVDITKELRLMELEPLHEAFRSILHSSELLTLHETIIRGKTGDSVREDFKRLRPYIDSVISIIDPKKASAISPADIFSEISGYLNSYATVIHLGREDASKFRPIADFLIGPSQGWKIVVLWILIHPFGKAIMSVSAGWFDEWLMQDLLEGLFSHMGGAKELVTVSPLLVKNLDIFSDRVQFSTRDDSRGYKEVLTFFKEPEFRTFLQVHQYSNEYWFNKERFDLFIKYLLAVVVIRQLRYKGFEKGPENDYYSMAQGVNFWSMKAEESNYNVEKFLKLLSMEHSR
ncbi:MAG TPA: alpha-amylase family glycosyl hydrolase, partial [Candidatus Hodarchaeales archaeon]|nr:alpha-amylase family glycosyl hydrolase [Candidatus Hodarchaeales archaeon]